MNNYYYRRRLDDNIFNAFAVAVCIFGIFIIALISIIKNNL